MGYSFLCAKVPVKIDRIGIFFIFLSCLGDLQATDIGDVNPPECYTFTGQTKTNDGHTWVSVNWNGNEVTLYEDIQIAKCLIDLLNLTQWISSLLLSFSSFFISSVWNRFDLIMKLTDFGQVDLILNIWVNKLCLTHDASRDISSKYNLKLN